MAARPATAGRRSPQVLEVSAAAQNGLVHGEQLVMWLASTTSQDRAAAEELRNGGRQLDCGALQQLVGALEVEGAFPRLRRLDLSNSLLTDDGCVEVAGGLLALQQRPIGGLSCLLASGNQIGHKGAEVLATSFFCGGASSSTGRGGAGEELTLSLSENPLGDHGVVAVAAAVLSQECRAALQLCETSCGGEGCIALAQSLQRIAALDLSYNTVPTGALNMLVGALGPPLRQLGLCRVAPGGSGGLFRGPTVQALAASLAGDSPPPLAVLTLAGNGLQDDGMRTLAATLSSATVEELDLASNRLQDGNLLAQVLASGSLLSLSLDSNELDDMALVAIACGISASPRPTLQHLNLARNRFGDSGVEALVSAVQTQCGAASGSKAAEARLLPPAALDRWLRGLASAPEARWSAAAGASTSSEGQRGMRYLDLSFNVLTDESARKLAEAVTEGGAPNLRQLNLEQTCIEGPGREALEGAIRASQMRVCRAAWDASKACEEAARRPGAPGAGLRLWALPQPLLVRGVELERLDEVITADAQAWCEKLSASTDGEPPASGDGADRAAPSSPSRPAAGAGGLDGPPAQPGPAPPPGGAVLPPAGTAGPGDAGEVLSGALARTDEVLEHAKRSLSQAGGGPPGAPRLPGAAATPLALASSALQDDAKRRTEEIMRRARDVLQQAQESRATLSAGHHPGELQEEEDEEEEEETGSSNGSHDRPPAEREEVSPAGGGAPDTVGLSWAPGAVAPRRRHGEASPDGAHEGPEPDGGQADTAAGGGAGDASAAAAGAGAAKAAESGACTKARAKPPGPPPPAKAAVAGAEGAQGGAAASAGGAQGAGPLVLPAPPPPKAGKGKGKGKGGPPNAPKAPPKAKAPAGKGPPPAKAKAARLNGVAEVSKGPFHRKIYWKPLDVPDAEGTIFSPSQREARKGGFDAEALKKMFEGEASRASKHSRRSEGLLQQAQHRNLGTKLLSDHRARNIAIILKRLPVSTKELAKILEGLVWETTKLSVDDLELVLEVIPTQEEVEKLRQHQSPEAKSLLRDVEQLVLPLALLSRGAARVRLLCIARSARREFGSTARSLAAIRAACKAVHQSQMLREVMMLALDLGNYINHGDSSKGAKAITVGSLMTLRDFKTGRMSSLHFLCASLLRAEPERDAAEVLQRELRPAVTLAQLQVSNLQAVSKSFQRDLDIITVECRSYLQEYAEAEDGDAEESGRGRASEQQEEELEEYEALPTNEMEAFGDDVEDATRWVEDVMKIRGPARKRLSCAKRVVEKLCSLLEADMKSTADQAKAALKFCGVPPPSSQDLPADLEVLLQQLAEFLRVFKQYWGEVNRDISSYQQLFSGGISAPRALTGSPSRRKAA